MIKLRFTDPDIEHSHEVVAWLRDAEAILNGYLEKSLDETIVYGVGIEIIPVKP